MLINQRLARCAPALLLSCAACLLLTACNDEAVSPGEEPSPDSQRNSIAIVVAPSHASLGLPLPTHPIVELRDEAGRALPAPGVTITASISTGRLRGTTAIATDARGRAIFTELIIDSASGKVELGFSCCGLAPATRSLSLDSAAIVRLDPRIILGSAGSTLSPGPRVLLRDEQQRPRAGATVRFEFDGAVALPAHWVTTDTNGVATLPIFQLPDLPSSTELRAVDIATGMSVGYTLKGNALGGAYLERPLTAAVAGDVMTFPRVGVYDQFLEPVAGALVRYRIAGGEGTLSTAETHTDTEGWTEPVTFSTSSRGSTSIEVIAVGYSSKPILATVFAFVPPFSFEYAGPCYHGCPTSFDFTWPITGDSVSGMDVHFQIRVRDATGVIPGYVISIARDPEAPLLMEDASGFNFPLSEAEPLITDAHGIAGLAWRLPKAAGSYHFTMSGPKIDTPWTYTATVE